MLTVEQLEFWNFGGYLVVPDLLAPQEVDEWLATPFPQDVGPHDHFTDAKYARMIAHPKVRDIVTELIGGEPLVTQSMWLNKQPNGTGIAMHQDHHYIKTEPETLMACWIAFDDADGSNGTLRVMPGSHRDNGGTLYPIVPPKDETQHASWVVDHTYRERDGREYNVQLHSAEIEGWDGSREKILEVPAGGGVFFTGKTVHGSYRNDSDHPRRVFAIHYVRKDTWVYRSDIQRLAPLTGLPIDRSEAGN